MRPGSTPLGSVDLVLGSDNALRAGVMVIPATCHGTHTLAMATPNVELLKQRVRLCRRQVLHVHARERGVKRFLRDGFRLAPGRESGHEEADVYKRQFLSSASAFAGDKFSMFTPGSVV